MQPLQHPTWPARWMLIVGVIGAAFYAVAALFVLYSAVHYILKFW